MIFNKLIAIFTRDARLAVTYRLSFLMQWIGIAATVAGLYFVSKLVPASSKFGFGGGTASYFDFAIVNVAFLSFQAAALNSFEKSIRDDQLFGTLEATFATPTSVGVIVLGSGLWAFTLTALNAAFYLLVGALFGMRFDHLNSGALVMLLILTITSTIPLGILAAAGVMVMKQSAPIQFMVNMSASLLAGVMFPATLLPAWMQVLSWFLPISHALNGIRGAMHGASLAVLSSDLVWLSVASIVMLPFALMMFRCAVARAKFDGSLAQY
jgi:ABC-2 type transport system permease protein